MYKSIYSYCVRRRNGWGSGIGPRPTHCAECGKELAAPAPGSCSTGYGNTGEEATTAAELRALAAELPVLRKGEHVTRSRAICYPCCAENDRRDMIATGRAVLYLVDSQASVGRAYTVQNWPGSLSLPVRYSKSGRHNIARRRVDVWFTGPDGAEWHGVNIGDNQILRCRRIKGRP